MKNTLEAKSNIHGKLIYTHECALKFDANQITEHLQNYSLVSTARAICTLSRFCSGIKSEESTFNNIPVSDTVLNEALTLACRYCAREGGHDYPDDELELLIRIAYGELDRITDKTSPIDTFNAIAYQQFPLQESVQQSLARNWYIFSEIWKRKERITSPLTKLQEIIGASYSLCAIYAFAISWNEDGYFYAYDEDTINELKEKLSNEVSSESFQLFLSWISCTRAEVEQHKIGNIFTFKPVLASGIIPAPGMTPAYFCSAPKLLLSKVSSGAYFTLCSAYDMGGKNNSFKSDYGEAFEEYVGDLLKNHLTDWDVSPEITYSKQNKKSIDYFVLKDDKLLLIEVKQSSIFLNSKLFGEENSIKSDLSKTVLKAVDQLYRSEKLLKTAPEFRKFKHCRHIEKMIVLADPLYNANSLMKDLLSKSTLLNLKPIHIINIAEFETLLDAQKQAQSLFDVLQFKRINAPEFDFKEYIISMYKSNDFEWTFIKDVIASLFPEKMRNMFDNP